MEPHELSGAAPRTGFSTAWLPVPTGAPALPEPSLSAWSGVFRPGQLLASSDQGDREWDSLAREGTVFDPSSL